MSRKISNILVICALVVIFPLLVIGSAFAAYYSINASVTVGIYTDYTAKSVSASVVYNLKANTEEFEIAGSHAKVITLKANSTGYNFIGWFNGNATKYDEAVGADEVEYFSKDKELNVKISDYENILAVYEIVPFTITYNVNGTEETQTVKGSTKLKSAVVAATQAELGDAATGKKWAWVDDETGDVITTAEGNVSVTLTQVDIVYTINVNAGNGITYTGNSVKANYTDTAVVLNDLFSNTNYNTTLSFKSFGSFEFAGNTYANADGLWTAIKAAYQNADTTITLTPIVNNRFDNIEVNVVKYRAYDAAENLYDAIVYNAIESEVQDDDSAETIDSTTTINSWLKIFSTTFYTDAENTERVSAYEINITIGGATCRFTNFDETTTINDILEFAYNHPATGPKMTATGATLEIGEVLVKLA